jgi:hypothetical protein
MDQQGRHEPLDVPQHLIGAFSGSDLTQSELPCILSSPEADEEPAKLSRQSQGSQGGLKTSAARKAEDVPVASPVLRSVVSPGVGSSLDSGVSPFLGSGVSPFLGSGVSPLSPLSPA